MGTPSYADEILKKLLNEESFDIVGVFTQPDKPVGRKQILTPPPVKVSAEKSGIPVFQPEKLRNSVDEVKNLQPDFIVVGAYGQILSKAILDIAPAINLHTSILPKYRGASPIQQSLLNGDSETGVTSMLMSEGLDEGDTLGVYRLKIEDSWTLEDLYNRLTELAGDLAVETVLRFNELSPTPQISADASHCTKIRKEDGLIEWRDSSEVVKKWRGLTPWPSIYLESGLKIFGVSQAGEGNFREGEILEVGKDKITVGCRNGSVSIEEVQPKSKKRMGVISYLNGKRLGVGDILE
jgi:methionyl-tRNA formyltransferase